MIVQSALSDRGRMRERNEDAHAATTSPGGQLFCVADGMGGYEAGDVASQSAVAAAVQAWRQLDAKRPMSWRLAHCLAAANDAVLAEANRRGVLGKMGSTLVLLAVQGREAFVAHAGDSRAYRLRAGHLERLTTDHTEAQERVASGELEAAAADASAYSHVLVRALGLNDPVVPDITGPHALAPDDTFLLCSDGLTVIVNDTEIADVMRYHGCEETSRVLVALANSRGGPDNITVQLIRNSPNAGPLEAAPADYKVPYGLGIDYRKVAVAAAMLLAIVVLVVVCI